MLEVSIDAASIFHPGTRSLFLSTGIVARACVAKLSVEVSFKRGLAYVSEGLLLGEGSFDQKHDGIMTFSIWEFC